MLAHVTPRWVLVHSNSRKAIIEVKNSAQECVQLTFRIIYGVVKKGLGSERPATLPSVGQIRA